MFQRDPGCATRRRRGVRAEGGGSARVGRRGAGRVRGAAPAPAAAAMPILVRAAAGAGPRRAARSLRTRRASEAFACGRPSSRRARAPRAPPLAAPNFGQRRPRSVPATGQVRSGTHSCHREPGCSQPRAPEAKSGSESWIPAPLAATSRARAAPAWAPSLGGREPRPRPAGRALPGFPVLGSRSFSLGVGGEALDPQVSAAATWVWGRQRAPALGPHRVPFPRSASGGSSVSSASPLPAGPPPAPTAAPPRPLEGRGVVRRGGALWPRARTRELGRNAALGAHPSRSPTPGRGEQRTRTPSLRSRVSGAPGDVGG